MNCTAGVQTSLILGVALSPGVKLTVASNKFLSPAPPCRLFSLCRLFFFNGRVVDVRCLSSRLLWSLCGCVLRLSPASGPATKQTRLAGERRVRRLLLIGGKCSAYGACMSAAAEVVKRCPIFSLVVVVLLVRRWQPEACIFWQGNPPPPPPPPKKTPN